MNQSKPTSSFEDLEVYLEARRFRKAMYEVSRRLPECEKEEMGSQIRCASLSLTSRLAAAHGRSPQSDQIRLLLQARGSAHQLIDYLNAAADEQYLGQPEIDRLKAQAWQVLQLLSDYVGSLREDTNGQTPQRREVASRFGELDSDIEQWIKSIT